MPVGVLGRGSEVASDEGSGEWRVGEEEERFLTAQADHLAGARWDEKESTCSARNDRWGARELFVEEKGLGGSAGGGLAAGDADYAEDGYFGEGGSGDEDSVGGGV
jgi:hypothetical protein